MSDHFLRLSKPPGLSHPGYPICDACNVETEHDGDGWLCPSCGTAWPGDNMEAFPSEATMFPDWSGEGMTGPVCPNDLAWKVSHLSGYERDALVKRLTEEVDDN